MKIAIGADHRGFEKKQHLMQALCQDDLSWVDVGCHSAQRCDFPQFALSVASRVKEKEVSLGILLCGTGNGMAIVANRVPGIFAALAWNAEIARLSKEHNNANILVIPSDYVSNEDLVMMVRAWLQARFLGGRYQERINLIDQIK